MPARIAPTASRLAVVLTIVVAFGAVAAPVAARTERPVRREPSDEPVAQEVRPEPVSGGVTPIRVDIEPGGPTPKTPPPSTLDLFRAEGFRYQDPNYSACTAASALVMLNTIALNGNGGAGFRWAVRLGIDPVNSILSWERTHDTLAGGSGSDPHGWRNALNYYGWGSGALASDTRIYDDFAYTSYAKAVKNAIRQLIRTRKPVGILAWGGRHAQFITGYDGLSGNPFAKDGNGRYTNAFTINAVYLTDPLKADGFVDTRVSYAAPRELDERAPPLRALHRDRQPVRRPVHRRHRRGKERVAEPLGDHRPDPLAIAEAASEASDCVRRGWARLARRRRAPQSERTSMVRERGAHPSNAVQRRPGATANESATQSSKRLLAEPLRCCPGEGIRRNGRFCRASRASITSAAPTTLTLPTHDLVAGAAWPLFAAHAHFNPWIRDSKGFDAQRDVNSLTFAATSASVIQPSWMVTLVIATGSEGFSRSAAEAIASTTSRPFVTCPNSV